MKIACITDDGRTISQHFGRALHYVVLTVEDGQIVGREMRDKLGHQHLAAAEHQDAPGVPHGTDPASHDRHTRMAQAIADCQVLLCRGMGYGAYQSMQRLGITPIVTDVGEVDAAVLAYVQGRLADHPERLH
jgi:predicted Fe-Mo cluster-binding NifX family protein